MSNQLYLRSYMMFDKWSSFAIPKTEDRTPITNQSHVLVVVQFTWVKLK